VRHIHVCHGLGQTMICGRWPLELVLRRSIKQTLLPGVQLKLAIIGTCVGVIRCTALSLMSVPFVAALGIRHHIVAVLGRRRGSFHHPSWVLPVIHRGQLGLPSSVMVEGCKNLLLTQACETLTCMLWSGTIYTCIILI
jgi:hypothetical protein